MNWGTFFKYTLAAVGVGVVAYGGWRGYKTVKGAIDADKRNRAELARIQAAVANQQNGDLYNGALNEVTQLDEGTQRELEAAVNAARAEADRTGDIRKMSFRTGGIVSPETIVRTQVLCEDNLEETESKVRTSFYSGVVDAAIQAKEIEELDDLLWEAQMTDAFSQVLEQRVKEGSLVEDEIQEWAKSNSPDISAYPLPTLSEILNMVRTQGRDKVIQHFVKRSYSSAPYVGDTIVVSADEVTVDIKVEDPPDPPET